jgi:hypothetical protein
MTAPGCLCVDGSRLAYAPSCLPALGRRTPRGTHLRAGLRLTTADEENSATDLLGDTAVTKSVTNPALSDT